MATFTKQDNGRVIYEDDSGLKTGFSSSLNVVPHPDQNSLIILTSTGSNQSQMLNGFLLDWNNVSIPLAASRNELIELLSLNYFNDSVGVANNGIVDANNSTTQTLLADIAFTGAVTEVKDYGIIYITTKSDVASAIDGLSIQQSSDGVNWDHTDEYTINAGSGKTFSFQAGAQYFRVVYTNGIADQTFFRLQTLFKKGNGKPSSHRLRDPIVNDDDAELVKSVIAVQTIEPDIYANVDVQNPLPSDGDSVYAKDILLELSDEGDFIITADPTASKIDILSSMVSDVHIEKKNDTSNNPKTYTLTFKRPVLTASFGIDAGPIGDFSNAKVTIFQGQASEVIIDESADNTKYPIRLFPIGPVKFSKILIEFYTADTVTVGLTGIFKNTEVAARLQAISELTDSVEDIASFRGALKVDTALVHKQGVNLFFFKEDTVNTTIAVETTAEDTAITVVDSTGFIVGDKVRVTGTVSTGQSFMTITIIVANLITLDRPIGSILPIGNAVDVVITDLSVDGTLTSPIIFRIEPPALAVGPIWQLTRLMISITDGSAMDDGKFGGGVALPNGMNLRVLKGNGDIQNITNWKTNGDIALDMYDVTYTDKAPAGENGLRGRWTFTKSEFVVELDGQEGDIFELRVQDLLSAQTKIEVKCQGRIFGE